jgi:hypothetical protein
MHRFMKVALGVPGHAGRVATREAFHGLASQAPAGTALNWFGRHGRFINPGTGALVGAGLSAGKDLVTGNPDEDGKDQGVSLTKAMGSATAGAGLGLLGRMGTQRYLRHGVQSQLGIMPEKVKAEVKAVKGVDGMTNAGRGRMASDNILDKMTASTERAKENSVKLGGTFRNFMGNVANKARTMAAQTPASAPAQMLTKPEAPPASPGKSLVPLNTPPGARQVSLETTQQPLLVGRAGIGARLAGMFQGKEQRAANASDRTLADAEKAKTLASLADQQASLAREREKAQIAQVKARSAKINPFI